MEICLGATPAPEVVGADSERTGALVVEAFGLAVVVVRFAAAASLAVADVLGVVVTAAAEDVCAPPTVAEVVGAVLLVPRALSRQLSEPANTAPSTPTKSIKFIMPMSSLAGI